MALFSKKSKKNQERDEKNKELLAQAVNGSGKTEEEVLEEIDILKKEYGISGAFYFRKELYKLPKEKLIRRADKIRTYRKTVADIAEDTGQTPDEVKVNISEAKEKYGIAAPEYYRYGYYKLSGEEQEEFHKARLEKKKEREDSTDKKTTEDWAFLITTETGWTMEKAKERLTAARKKFKISSRLYYKYRYFEMTEETMAADILRRRRRRDRTQDCYRLIEEISGKDRETARRDIQAITDKGPIIRTGIRWYFVNGAYELDPEKDSEKIDRLIMSSAWAIKLRNIIHKNIQRVDQNELSYDDLEEDVKEYVELRRQTLSEARKEQLWENIQYIRADIADDEEARSELLLDMEVTQQLLGFQPPEYVSFHFWEVPFWERREYINSGQRAQALRMLNSGEATDLLNSKYAAYCKLKPYYNREVCQIGLKNGYETFIDFCKRHSVFVKKDNYDALGRGVVKVDTTEGTPLKNIYEDLTEGGKAIILEELIKPAEELKKLNPDSVNTVRVITYMDKEEPKIQDCFMKIGREGSFVDNGGAGGILVHIDHNTGTFNSKGLDEHGFRYDKHPDHGYVFEGIKLPEWDKAIELAKKVATEVHGLGYAGWDLTYSEAGWIIVEGNAMTQFIGQQGTLGRGRKKEFLESINYEGLMADQVATQEEDDEVGFSAIPEMECFFMEDQITYDMKRSYLEERGLTELRYVPDLDDPKTLNEKILWLALNYKNPNIARAVDKTTAKDYITEVVGEGYTIPTYGVYDHLSKIDFDALPDSFVIKLNDGWAKKSVAVVDDKTTTDLNKLCKEIASWLYPWNNYYYHNMCITDEKMDKSSVIIEKRMLEKGSPFLTDYKVYCFNGEPKLGMTIEGRESDKKTVTFVDMDWNPLPVGRLNKRFSLNPAKPVNLDKMIELSKTLSKDFPLVRVDFYEIDGKLYVGELTFTPGMFLKFSTKEWDYRLGEMLDLEPCMKEMKK